MQYFVTRDELTALQTDCIVVAVYQNGQLSSSAEALNKASQDKLSQYYQRGDITGKPGQLLLLQDLTGMQSPRVLLAGAGEQNKTTENDYNTVTNAVARWLNTSAVQHAVSCLAEIPVSNRQTDWKVRQAVINTETSQYHYHQTKSQFKPVEKPLENLGFPSTDSEASTLESACQTGAAIGHGMNLARELGNLPGNVCTPTYLANQALDLGEKYNNLVVDVLEEADMAELGMGSLLSVSRGSRQPAKLITLNYGGGGNSKPYVLVGKGLTFDAGGISLKPAPGMDEMKYDMCGAASVIGTLQAVAELQLPINVIGVVPSSENLPDGDANKPGDVVTSMSGQTIEILNTDAEGRLILCDALTYSERFDPATVIDIATLTGAIIVALGSNATGLMSNDQNFADTLIAAGLESHDRVWQLPLWDDYQKQLDSNFADIANIGGKEAGSVTAACFLSRFTKKFTWAHLDIAGTAWNSGKDKGATGRPVPLLMQYLLNQIAD
ncbi:Cytosol aminopeptidase PepA [Methylophaga frappieri]|uniref:Probable cytosol aminopeptidase n=1 Tax=Methylophaga frappieri (strain ATCC BAA-2434 / DSM 25690 / JAM7) TaxID=754477 RepID=I1YL33_METFJ|nr:leucyl aminopeptidase [Methylophaga frappieri]AFJ03626.1 Cytosol aminopeptidase PepA [Methylophaga frappieri]